MISYKQGEEIHEYLDKLYVTCDIKPPAKVKIEEYELVEYLLDEYSDSDIVSLLGDYKVIDLLDHTDSKTVKEWVESNYELMPDDYADGKEIVNELFILCRSLKSKLDKGDVSELLAHIDNLCDSVIGRTL